MIRTRCRELQKAIRNVLNGKQTTGDEEERWKSQFKMTDEKVQLQLSDYG